jgi:arginine/ornithine N-succinyltransferase beta subunit
MQAVQGAATRQTLSSQFPASRQKSSQFYPEESLAPARSQYHTRPVFIADLTPHKPIYIVLLDNQSERYDQWQYRQ